MARLEIIPAIDLLGGQAVRLKKGDYGTSEKVAEDPIAVAEGFAAQGARRIHVVDLDGSRSGAAGNADTVAAIIRAVPNIPVQVGGGVRSVEAAERLFGLGADRVIVGTAAAAQDVVMIAALLEKHGPRVIVGADSTEGFIAVHGWQEHTGERTEDFARRLVGLGARRFLFTDVARDGMLQGPNIDATVALARAAGVPVIASGGVSGPADISALARVQPEGVEGVIIGKALYAGRLTLADALRLAGD
jgi:phosphoribosylformimino-5-aminoimidazole carboxamide ribotide isomerase